MTHPKLHTVGRYLGVTLLAFLGLVVTLLGAVILVAGSDWGHQKLLTLALPAANNALTGRLEIGSLGGDLVHRLVLREIKLYDSEKELAVSVGQLELRYNLLALLRKNVHLTAAEVVDGKVRVRYLQDGRLNLAALLKPRPPSGPLPVSITVGGIAVDLAAHFEPQDAAKIPPASALLHLEASAQIVDPRITLDLQTLKVHASEPLHGDVEVHGGVYVVTGEPLHVEARKLALLVRTSGEQVNRLVPTAELLGDWELAMAFQGPLTALGIEGALRPPKGLLGLRGTVGVLDPKLPWQVQLDGHAIDPAAARQGLPTATVDLQVSGLGQGPVGRVELRQLAVKALGASLNASGFADGNAQKIQGLPLPAGTSAQLALNLDAPDLAALVGPLAPPSLKPAGALRVDAKAGFANGQLRLDIEVDGKKLRAAGNAVEQLTLALHSTDLMGRLTLHAKALRSPLPLERLELDSMLSEHALSVHAIGRDAKTLRFELTVDGQPHRRGLELLSLDANLRQLLVSRGGQRLELRAPAQLRLDLQPPSGPIVAVDRLALRLGEQQLTVAARYEAKTQRFRASLDALAINAKQWAEMFGVAQVPKTSLSVHAQAAGTPQDPEGRLKLSGSIAPMPQHHLPRSELRVAVTLHNQRAQGDVALQLFPEPGTAEVRNYPYATARFDAPLSTQGPLQVELDAATSTQPWQALFPGAAAGLRGFLVLHTTLRGTLQQPELELTLKSPAWQFRDLRGRSTTLAVSYAQQKLGVGLDSQLASAQQAPLAGITVNAQTRVRLGLIPGMTAAGIKQQLMSGALAVDASVSRVDLAKVLRALAPGQEPPLQAGLLDATLHIEGTPLAPILRLNVDSKGLAASSIKNLSVGAAVSYAGNDLKVDVNAGLPQQPLLKAHAETTLAVQRLLTGNLELKQLPVRGLVSVQPFELSQVSKVRGSVTARAEVRGTIGTPEVTAWVRSQSVQLDNFAVGPLNLDLTLDPKHLLKANLEARQPSGQLRVVAKTQLPPRADSLELAIEAKNFCVDYNPRPGTASLSDAVGMARGVLNADLHVQGAAAGPSVRGSLKLENGALAMKALQQSLSDVRVDIQVEPDGQNSRRSLITLREARVAVEGGRAKVAGSIKLDGLTLSSLSLDSEAKQFPVWAGVMGIWIDSKVAIRGQTRDNTLSIVVKIAEGGVRLPKLQSARSVQALGPFEDVRLVDQAAQQTAARLREAQRKEAEQKAAEPEKPSGFLPKNLRIAVQLPDNFHLAGPEVRADLTGNLELALDRGGEPRITGQVLTAPSWGWVEILNRRYDITHLRASLSGESPPNPLLSAELKRKLDEATMFIMVSGSAKKPKIKFRSDPPIYDESQIIAMILTGESGSSKKDPQALGMLSSLVLGQLRNQLAGRLPVDVIRMDVAGDDPLGVGQSSLEVGKFLRDDLYLGYKRRFGSAATGMRRLNADEALLEYHFFKNYKLKTLYGDANVGAVDFYWTKRF